MWLGNIASGVAATLDVRVCGLCENGGYKSNGADVGSGGAETAEATIEVGSCYASAEASLFRRTRRFGLFAAVDACLDGNEDEI